MASFCQLQFGWNAGQVSSKFIKLVYSRIVLQSLLKAHVNSGFSSDGVFPRSSVLRILEAKALSGSSLTQYRVEISTGALGLQVKPGLRDASAFPSGTLMCTWIPASSVVNLKRNAKHSRKKPSASPARLHTVASAASAPVGGPSVFRREIIDLTSPEPKLHM
ncbi:hypothetical protein B0H14DRAFT_2762088 [Mycena olivaceomarginata]|nr:hypothetical protein B0H14DRAFT_2762088 [Mycena olivaceomarginata]